MKTALYDTLTPGYRLLDATAEHEEEVAGFVAALASAIEVPRATSR